MRLSTPGAPALKPENIRMWQASDKDLLLSSFGEIGDGEQRMEVDNPSDGGSTQGQSEENSGIKFPGESVEPYVGSQLTIDEFDVRNKVLLIEVATPKFAFLYEDKGRIQIGDCEFCSNRRILKVVCKCKRVKYCGN